MPIVLRHNEALDLNLAEYAGSISMRELMAIADHQGRHPESLQRDCLNLVRPDAHFDTVARSDLDALFEHYKVLFSKLNLHLFRRAAWICNSARAQAHINYWLGGDTRGGMSSLVRQFATIAEAGDWLVLNPMECAIVERADGFAEVARFDAPALTLVSAARSVG